MRLDTFSDSESGCALGNIMLVDLVSVAGQIYKHGINGGLSAVSLDVFIQIFNKFNALNDALSEAGFSTSKSLCMFKAMPINRPVY